MTTPATPPAGNSLVHDLVEAGIHFGQRSAAWNPAMQPYIYGKRNGIHIIDIKETVKGLLLAKKFIAKTVADGKDVCFVGTKRQARAVIEQRVGDVKMHWVTERWLGGTLTNFRTIRSRLKRLEELEAIAKSENFASYSKKMESQLKRERDKIFKNLSGIRAMDKLPGALIVVDVSKEINALREARKLGIPTICLIDTDGNPELADIAKEFYLSLLVDRETSRVSVVASTEGGMDIETVAHDTPDKIITFSIDPVTGIWPHHGRALSKALGLSGGLAKEAATLLSQLYTAFVAKDMSMLEINPLIVTGDDHLRVLDAKISFDSNALFRHPDIVALRDESEEDAKEIEASKFDLSYIALDGEIGCMVNGAGLAMATMDIIKLYGAEPANFLDVGGGADEAKVTAAFKIIMADPNVKGILVNIFGGIARCDTLANGVCSILQ